MVIAGELYTHFEGLFVVAGWKTRFSNSDCDVQHVHVEIAADGIL